MSSCLVQPFGITQIVFQREAITTSIKVRPKYTVWKHSCWVTVNCSCWDKEKQRLPKILTQSFGNSNRKPIFWFVILGFLTWKFASTSPIDAIRRRSRIINTLHSGESPPIMEDNSFQAWVLTYSRPIVQFLVWRNYRLIFRTVILKY